MSSNAPWPPPPPGQRPGLPPQAVWNVPVPRPRRRESPGITALLLGGGVLVLAGLALVIPFLLSSTGSAGFAIGFVLSLVPLAVVLGTVAIVDRWEPEPKRLLAFALAWGAVVSIATTTLVQPAFVAVFGPHPAGRDATRLFLATVEAPFVEEISKGLGLLVLFLVARKYFDGPIDGVVYGMTIAAGFAFTENILYFGRAFDGGDGSTAELVVVFMLRGILSPFAHAMFTGTLGAVMGFAARRWNAALGMAAFVVGLVPAMLLHRLWNSSGDRFFLVYAAIEVPLFGVAIACVYLLRRSDARLTHRRLAEYAAAGWFTPLEVDMLATPRGRSAGMRWAVSRGRGDAMRRFIRVATDLAYTRQRAVSGRDVRGYVLAEQELLREAGRLREAVVAP
ncbi:PrsW family intramembrane metalloprotease [Sinomonas sp. JGH33]|uniref:PrsW family intramembrane metalloprotease n=1 Tax=Sinomonas terricola TaxID=3110330 RepID=A0ABU5T752_9MICC|nr:PrsW family intramembrane metalloprotease [Sinomonas sp. JGH33]MEA5455352.1 PrsW family intramembrane metalloprotease [Sinomonas sp. JGH33]